MDIPFDQFGGHRASLTAVPETVGRVAPLDWPGLAARLAAAHATRQVLAIGHSPHATGSFAPDIARDLAGWGASSSLGVNLNPKADGKPRRTIARNDAGDDRFIVRGRL